MKITMISKAVCAVAVMFSLTSFASEKKGNGETSNSPNKIALSAAVFQVQNTHKVKLAVDKDVQARLSVVLKDKTGRIYYRETYGKGDLQYRRVFDLDDMNDGTYYFELTSGDQKVTKEVDIRTTSDRVISID